MKLIELEEVDSTNDYLKREYQNLPMQTCVTAKYQTKGRGRNGHVWESHANENLIMSFLFKDFHKIEDAWKMTQLTTCSVVGLLDRYRIKATIKWPNDIYWNEKKICGILIENDLLGHHIGRSISGIGVNINQEVFRSDAPNPVSLKQITGEDHDRYLILANIMKRIKEYYTLLRTDCSGKTADLINTRYAHSLFRRNGFHRYADANGEFLACLLRVEPDGRFILEDQEGKERGYLFKEVQYIL